MEKVYDFLEVASQAASLFNRYYHSSYDAEKNELTEWFGWEESDIYAKMKKKYSFSDACKSLIDRYSEIFNETDSEEQIDFTEYGDAISYIVENKLLTLDEAQRRVIISRIIKRSAKLIINGWSTMNSAYQISLNREKFGKGKRSLELYDTFCILNYFLEEAERFLSNIGDLCQDYNIDVKKICTDLFGNETTYKLYTSVFENGTYSSRYRSLDDLYKDKHNSVEVIEVGSKNKRRAQTTANQQYDAISALLKAAGWKGSDNTKTSEFIAWLVNGSQPYIRQFVMSGERRDKERRETDSKLIQEKFKLIGLTYENGKIKNE